MSKKNLDKALEIKLCDETLFAYTHMNNEDLEDETGLEDVLDILPKVGVNTIGELLRFADILEAGGFAGFSAPNFLPIFNLLKYKYLNIPFDTDYLSKATVDLCEGFHESLGGPEVKYKLFFPSLYSLGFSKEEEDFLQNYPGDWVIDYILKNGKCFEGECDYYLNDIWFMPNVVKINTYTIPLIDLLIKYKKKSDFKRSDFDYYDDYALAVSVAEKTKLCLDCYRSLEKNRVNKDDLIALKQQLKKAIEDRGVLDKEIDDCSKKVASLECLASLNEPDELNVSKSKKY